MKLYAATMIAWHEDDGEWIPHFAPGIVLAESDEDDARARTMPTALRLYPEADGWKSHTVGVLELPHDLEVEGYRLTWQITPIAEP